MNKGAHSVYLSMVFLYVTMGYVQMIMLNKQQTFRLRIAANDTEENIHNLEGENYDI